jgi:hypothetical protein
MKKERDYKKDYEDFWKEIVENKDGSLNKEQIMKELSDYSMLQENMANLFCLATGNKVSYVTTLPGVVYSLFEEELSDAYESGYNDGTEDTKESLGEE